MFLTINGTLAFNYIKHLVLVEIMLLYSHVSLYQKFLWFEEHMSTIQRLMTHLIFGININLMFQSCYPKLHFYLTWYPLSYSSVSETKFRSSYKENTTIAPIMQTKHHNQSYIVIYTKLNSFLHNYSFILIVRG